MTVAKLPFRVNIGILFFCYALAFSARQDVGVIRFVENTFNLSPNILILLFALCGAALILLPVRLPFVILLLLPLVLTVVAIVVRVLTDPASSVASLVGHGATLLLITRELIRGAMIGTNHE